MREPGQALHPERYDEKRLRAIKRTLPERFWNALYQQNPVPDDGAYFKKEWFRYAPLPEKEECRVYQAWDFAISEKKVNDYTVGTCGLQDYDDVLHIAEQVRFRTGDGEQIADAILSLAKRWYTPGLTIGVEDGQIWRSISKMVERKMRKMRFYPTVEVLQPITDKLARAKTLQGRMQMGQVSAPKDAPGMDEAERELLRFPAGAHDDIVDSRAWLALMVVDKPPPQPPKRARLKSWKDQIGGSSDSAGTTHMSA